jgi:hypothetical protein
MRTLNSGEEHKLQMKTEHAGILKGVQSRTMLAQNLLPICSNLK